MDFLTVSENHLSSLSISFGGGREDHGGPLSNGERNVRTERCYAPVSRETKGRCADLPDGDSSLKRGQALPFVDVFHARPCGAWMHELRRPQLVPIPLPREKERRCRSLERLPWSSREGAIPIGTCPLFLDVGAPRGLSRLAASSCVRLFGTSAG